MPTIYDYKHKYYKYSNHSKEGRDIYKILIYGSIKYRLPEEN